MTQETASPVPNLSDQSQVQGEPQVVEVGRLPGLDVPPLGCTKIADERYANRFMCGMIDKMAELLKVPKSNYSMCFLSFRQTHQNVLFFFTKDDIYGRV